MLTQRVPPVVRKAFSTPKKRPGYYWVRLSNGDYYSFYSAKELDASWIEVKPRGPAVEIRAESIVAAGESYNDEEL